MSKPGPAGPAASRGRSGRRGGSVLRRETGRPLESPRSYSTQRIVAAASERGHEPRVLDTLRFAIDLSGDVPDLQYRGRQLDDFDAVLPRIGASITFFGLAVVRQFEQMDVYTPTPSNGIANSRDKLRSIQILSRHDIAIPATTFVRDRADVLPAIDRPAVLPS